MKGVSKYGSGRGNTVCHLNTDESLFGGESSGGSAVQAASDDVASSSKAIESGRGGKGSGELARDKGSKPKDEHSGSGRKDSDFKVGESEGSVEDSGGVCGELETGNTVSRGGDKRGGADEVASVEERVDVDSPRVENGCPELGNTVPSGTVSSGPVLSENEAD